MMQQKQTGAAPVTKNSYTIIAERVQIELLE
jgi:hypothetical protein